VSIPSQPPMTLVITKVLRLPLETTRPLTRIDGTRRVSRGRRGMETFFGLLQKNLLKR